jgi:hypothetical protein
MRDQTPILEDEDALENIRELIELGYDLGDIEEAFRTIEKAYFDGIEEEE